MSTPRAQLEPSDDARAEDGGAGGAEARVPRPGTVVAGRYRIDGYVGRGGMGAVLSATHVVTGKRCAIKWVLPKAGDARGVARERLLREARMAGRIDHPNVVHVVDVGEHKGSIFLVMELLRGESLRSRIARGPLAIDDAVRLLMPVMRGVAAAHEVGIVHRDLKPDNVILARGEREVGAVRPTVLDFGISRGSEDGMPGDLTLTQTGAMMGTPLYMAPEQLAGRAEVDPRYDVYALGVILYELVTGARPFEGETYALLVSAKLNESPIPPSRWRGDLDPRFEKVVLRAMARRPRARFGSVRALATALEPFSEGCAFGDGDPWWRPSSGGTAIDATVALAAPPVGRRRFPWVVAFALAVLGGLLAGAWWSRGEEGPSLSERAARASAVPPEMPAARADAGAPRAVDDDAVAEERDEQGASPSRAGRGARGGRGRTGRLRVDEF